MENRRLKTEENMKDIHEIGKIIPILFGQTARLYPLIMGSNDMEPLIRRGWPIIMGITERDELKKGDIVLTAA